MFGHPNFELRGRGLANLGAQAEHPRLTKLFDECAPIFACAFGVFFERLVVEDEQSLQIHVGVARIDFFRFVPFLSETTRCEFGVLGVEIFPDNLPLDEEDTSC